MSQRHEVADELVIPSAPPPGESYWFQATGTCVCGWNLGGEGPTANRARTGLRMAYLRHCNEPEAAYFG